MVMAKFTINGASNGSSTRILALQYIRAGYYPSSSQCDVQTLERVHWSKYTTVYWATLQVHDGDHSNMHDVVIKTDLDAKVPRTAEFSREAEIYETLSKLQGNAIPVCFGLYQSTISDKCISILVTGYCGEDVSWTSADVSELSDEFKAKAMNKLFMIHQAGFQHGDLEDRNLLNKDGEPFFVDLERAKPHECKICQRVIMGDKNPGPDLGCREIWKLGAAMGVWADRSVGVEGFGYTFGYWRAMVSPDSLDDMMKAINRTLRDQTQRETMRAALEKLIQDVEEWRRQCEAITPAQRSFTPTSSTPLVLTR